jgi:hypothetical protein
MKPLYINIGEEEWLGKESCEGGEDCQVFNTRKNNVIPAWNKTSDHEQSLLSKGIKKESLLSQNCSNMEIYRSTNKNLTSRNINHLKHQMIIG